MNYFSVVELEGIITRARFLGQVAPNELWQKNYQELAQSAEGLKALLQTEIARILNNK